MCSLSGSVNQRKLSVFCLTGFHSQSSLVQRLIQAYLSPTSHFALVSFQSRLFLLHLLLSSVILSSFLLLSSNLCSSTVSFHSSSSGCPFYVILYLHLNQTESHSWWRLGESTWAETLRSFAPQILECWQENYRGLIVDTTACKITILTIMAKKHPTQYRVLR